MRGKLCYGGNELRPLTGKLRVGWNSLAEQSNSPAAFKAIDSSQPEQRRVPPYPWTRFAPGGARSRIRRPRLEFESSLLPFRFYLFRRRPPCLVRNRASATRRRLGQRRTDVVLNPLAVSLESRSIEYSYIERMPTYTRVCIFTRVNIERVSFRIYFREEVNERRVPLELTFEINIAYQRHIVFVQCNAITRKVFKVTARVGETRCTRYS